jgi:hypothetical protein
LISELPLPRIAWQAVTGNSTGGQAFRSTEKLVTLLLGLSVSSNALASVTPPPTLRDDDRRSLTREEMDQKLVSMVRNRPTSKTKKGLRRIFVSLCDRFLSIGEVYQLMELK